MARELLGRGWKDVHVLYGGFEAWQQANGTVEPKSRASDLLESKVNEE